MADGAPADLHAAIGDRAKAWKSVRFSDLFVQCYIHIHVVYFTKKMNVERCPQILVWVVNLWPTGVCVLESAWPCPSPQRFLQPRTWEDPLG